MTTHHCGSKTLMADICRIKMSCMCERVVGVSVVVVTDRSAVRPPQLLG